MSRIASKSLISTEYNDKLSSDIAESTSDMKGIDIYSKTLAGLNRIMA